MSSPTRAKNKDMLLKREDSECWDGAELTNITSRPVPIPMPNCRRSKSFLDTKAASIFSTPDMVSDLEQPSPNMVGLFVHFLTL